MSEGAYAPQTRVQACLALEARVHQFVGEDRVLIALVAEAWRQTYPEVPTEIELPL